MPTITVWVAYDNEGNAFASVDDAETAVSEFTSNFSAEGGLRVVEMSLELPEIKPIRVAATIPDTDGPVNVTIA